MSDHEESVSCRVLSQSPWLSHNVHEQRTASLYALCDDALLAANAMEQQQLLEERAKIPRAMEVSHFILSPQSYVDGEGVFSCTHRGCLQISIS